MAEQGIPGLLLWLGFIIWLATRPLPARSSLCYKGKSLARLFCLISFATAPLGLGMLDGIPSTATLLMLAGWSVARDPLMASTRRQRGPYSTPAAAMLA
jgi:hypothetical protein